jgi:hypothetical protein
MILKRRLITILSKRKKKVNETENVPNAFADADSASNQSYEPSSVSLFCNIFPLGSLMPD